MSSVVLISDLLHQSAAFIFLDGSRVSEGLELVKILVICLSAQLFLLFALMAATNVVNEVVHPFVADSRLLVFFPPYVCR